MSYDPLARRQLGRTSLRVTQLGLGTAPLGGFRGVIPEDEAVGTIRTAYDAGLRLFDTAPYYGYGRAELRVGEALRLLPRESFVLSTKVGRWLSPLRPGDASEGLRPGGLDFKPTYDLTYDGVMRSIEQSHCRLGMASIDILLIHDVDVFTHGSEQAADRRYREAIDGAYPALDGLRRQEVIKRSASGSTTSSPASASPARPT